VVEELAVSCIPSHNKNSSNKASLGTPKKKSDSSTNASIKGETNPAFVVHMLVQITCHIPNAEGNSSSPNCQGLVHQIQARHLQAVLLLVVPNILNLQNQLPNRLIYFLLSGLTILNSRRNDSCVRLLTRVSEFDCFLVERGGGDGRSYHEAGLADLAIAEQADLEADDVLDIGRVAVGGGSVVVGVPGERGEDGTGGDALRRRAEPAVAAAAAAGAGGAGEELVPDEADDPADDGEAEQAAPAEVEPQHGRPAPPPPPPAAAPTLRAELRDRLGHLHGCRRVRRRVRRRRRRHGVSAMHAWDKRTRHGRTPPPPPCYYRPRGGRR
jgi:hypothetical protein